MSTYRAIQFSPSTGGRLATSLSSAASGMGNYRVKRDFRRYLDQEIRSEGWEQFNPKPDQNAVAPTGEKITLVAMARQPNGRIAIVVGAKTTLYRYFGVDDGTYFDGDYFDGEYFKENYSDWLVIGSGFSPQGRRWEAVSINGYLVLNNAVDLPVTYRVEDLEVKPIYELREQGVASVGTIAEHMGILCCFDISMIDEDALEELMSPMASAVEAGIAGVSAAGMGKVNSGTDEEEGTVLTATGSDFNNGNGFIGLEGAVIRMANGLQRTIASVESATVCQLDGEPDLAEPAQPFYILGDTDNVVTVGVDEMFPGVDPDECVGLRLFWDSGECREIIGVYDGNYFVVDSDKPVPTGPVSLENRNAYAAYTDPAHITRIQYRFIWSLPDEPRRFGAVIPATTVQGSPVVTLKYPCKSVERGHEITIIGAGVGGGNLTATIVWVDGLKVLISEVAATGETKTVEKVVVENGGINYSSNSSVSFIGDGTGASGTLQISEGKVTGVTLTNGGSGYTVPPSVYVSPGGGEGAEATAVINEEDGSISLVNVSLGGRNYTTGVKAVVGGDGAGAELSVQTENGVITGVTVVSGGTNYKSDTTTITFVDGGTGASLTAVLKDVSGETQFMRSDAVNNIIGFEDLQDDGSAILKALSLRNYCVIYRDGSILLARYTGNVNQPWLVERAYVGENSLYFRNTLICVQGLYHLFAGRSSFFRFDLVDQTPIEVPEFQIADSLFFKAVTIEDDDDVFAADNALTKEIFFCFPSEGDDAALRFDYRFRTLSTTSGRFTAAATVKRPTGNAEKAQTHNWFLMGTADGELMRYGLTTDDIESSGAVTGTFSSGVVTASAAFFTQAHVGRTIMFANGVMAAIRRWLSSTEVQVLCDGEAENQTFVILPAIWHRDGVGYESILVSGLDSFGSPDATKKTSRYVLLYGTEFPFGSVEPGTTVNVALVTGTNQTKTSEAFSTRLTPEKNMQPWYAMGYYLGDKLTISGRNNPAAISGRVISVLGIKSRSFERRP